MKLNELFNFTFYSLAYRSMIGDKANSDRTWQVIQSKTSEWYADPFVFESEGRHYLFAERMSRWRLLGSIAVCEIYNDKTTSRFKEVLVEPFHLSYPNVFKYKDNIYMIPESGSNLDIRLYVSTHFPYKWEFVKVLYSGSNYADTSFISDVINGKAFLCSMDWDTKIVHFFLFDLDNLTFIELPENPNMINERSGGNFYEEEKKKCRVLQDCSTVYGSKIMISQLYNQDFVNGNGSDSVF